MSSFNSEDNGGGGDDDEGLSNRAVGAASFDKDLDDDSRATNGGGKGVTDNINNNSHDAASTHPTDNGSTTDSSRHSRSSSYARHQSPLHFSFNFGSTAGRPSQKSLQEYFLSERSHHGINGAGSSSYGVTFSAQNQLPRLPIPTLEETMDKFPKVLEALQDARQQEETRRIVQEFLAGDGPKLQEALLEYERIGIETGTWGSYVEEFWNESYLAPDASVVLNLNPFFVLEDAPDPKIAKDQLKRAAGLCFASIKIASLLQHETLSPDVFKGKPLCMDQFKALFGSSRQPSHGVSDEVHVYSDSSHVVVMSHNQFYYFPALWPDTGEVAVDETDILEILRAIHLHSSQISPEEANRTALGGFTSLPRSEWAVARQKLCENERNETALNIIDSALFVLVLDDYTPDSVHSAAANMLHGTNQLAPNDTYQVGTCLNRWYDKLQLIVCKDGTAGCNFEHSAIDGHTALRFVSDVFAETVISFAESIVDLIHGRGRIQHVVEAKLKRAASIIKHEDDRTLDVYPKRIVFDLSESVMDRIYFAETALCDEVSSSDTFVLEFMDFGKLLIVANRLSPDSVVQMSIMIAYYRLYGKVVCTYEPVLTKSFYHGRTEAMRSATPLAKRLCEIWCRKTSTKDEKLHALRDATVLHSRLVAECAKGRGVDRHLFSLKCIAERKGMPTPAFFQSEAWKTLNHTILSTSNCGNPALRLFGFGPVVPDGFGVGYIIKDNALSFSVSSKHRQTQRYVRALRTTLNELGDLLERQSLYQVQTRSISLREQQKQQQEHRRHHIFSYDDVYGESSATIPEDRPVRGHHLAASATTLPFPPDTSGDRHRAKSTGSKFFTQVREKEFSVRDVDEPGVRINLDLDGQEREDSEH